MRTLFGVILSSRAEKDGSVLIRVSKIGTGEIYLVGADLDFGEIQGLEAAYVASAMFPPLSKALFYGHYKRNKSFIASKFEVIYLDRAA